MLRRTAKVGSNRDAHHLSWRAAALAAIVSGIAGATLGLVLAPDPAPKSLQAIADDKTVALQRRTYDDARMVQVQPRTSPERQLNSPGSGVLLASQCQVGDRLASGSFPIQLEDRPIVALALRTPLWRNLAPGVHGDDVTALQSELRALGLDAAITGTFDAATSRAVRALWQKADVRDLATIPLDRVIWLPAHDLTITGCPAAIGTPLSPGTPVMTTGNQLISLHVSTPKGAVPGDRVLRVDDKSTPVPANSEISDRDFLATVAASDAYQSWLGAGERQQLTLGWALAKPLNVVAVPPSALYQIEGTLGCLLADGQPAAVTLVASELGQTFVSGQDLPTHVVIDPPAGAQPCR